MAWCGCVHRSTQWRSAGPRRLGAASQGSWDMPVVRSALIRRSIHSFVMGPRNLGATRLGSWDFREFRMPPWCCILSVIFVHRSFIAHITGPRYLGAARMGKEDFMISCRALWLMLDHRLVCSPLAGPKYFGAACSGSRSVLLIMFFSSSGLAVVCAAEAVHGRGVTLVNGKFDLIHKCQEHAHRL